MNDTAATVTRTPPGRPWRVACVSFFNTAPLIYGLDRDPDIELRPAVPSKLLDELASGRADVALLPVIDYQRLNDAVIVPAAGIGCNGPTLTVRIFSPVPIDRIDTLACDPDSHTSVALARVLLAESIAPGRAIEFVDLRDAKPLTPRLLIGDKVITASPSPTAGFEHQLDLGEAWKRHTGLPFVFAVWTTRAGVALGNLPARLATAKRDGLAHVNELVERHAVPKGWPADTARRYLTEYLKFDVGERQLEAIHRFHAAAADLGLVAKPARSLSIAN